jgi:hypothetical protein
MENAQPQLGGGKEIDTHSKDVELQSLPKGSGGSLLLTDTIRSSDLSLNSYYEESSKALVYQLEPLSSTYIFLAVCGLIHIHPSSVIMTWLLRLWSCFVFLTLVVGYLLFSTALFVQDPPIPIPRALAAIALILQLIGIIITSYLNVRRLSRKCRICEVGLLKESVSAVVGMAIVVVSCDLIVLLKTRSLSSRGSIASLNFCVWFGIEMSVLLLGASLAFMILDAMFVEKLLQKLIQQLDDRCSIKFGSLEEVRAMTTSVVDGGFVMNTTLISVALFNVLTAFVISVFSSLSTDSLVINLFYVSFREIAAAMVGLYYVAKANEANNRLVGRLAIDVGLCCKSFDISNVLESPAQVEALRLNILLNNLTAVPIRFPLVGMVLTRRDVFVRFGLWCIGVLIGIVRNKFT